MLIGTISCVTFVTGRGGNKLTPTIVPFSVSVLAVVVAETATCLLRVSGSTEPPDWTRLHSGCVSLTCTIKGRGRQGIGLKHRNCLQKSLCPAQLVVLSFQQQAFNYFFVVPCPYLCSPESLFESPEFRTQGSRPRSSEPRVRDPGVPYT